MNTERRFRLLRKAGCVLQTDTDPARNVRIPTDGKGTGIGLIVLHLGTLLALIPATFSWSGVIVAVVLCNLTGGLGLSLGFHRMLTHQSLRVPRWLRYTIAVLGTLGMKPAPSPGSRLCAQGVRPCTRRALAVGRGAGARWRNGTGGRIARELACSYAA
jgi:hypothetical protein